MTRTALSERTAWDDVEEIGRDLLYSPDVGAQQKGRELMAKAVEMKGQLRRGIHQNPPLVVFGNPPHPVTVVQVVSPNVHELCYTHADNGEDFRHVFAGEVELVAVTRGRLKEWWLRHAHGKPLWKDFKGA